MTLATVKFCWSVPLNRDKWWAADNAESESQERLRQQQRILHEKTYQMTDANVAQASERAEGPTILYSTSDSLT